MSITREDVDRVALLARLKLDAVAREKMTSQLAQIVGYIEVLSELDTESIPPMAHPSDLANVFAADQVGPSLDRRAALAGAPRDDGECYLVPAVLGD